MVNEPGSGLMPVFGVRFEDIELLGVEILFDEHGDPRGPVWVPFQSGMTVLYGRNGAGKTTVLQAVNAALSGVAVPGQRSRLFLRLLATEEEVAEDLSRREKEHDDLLLQWDEQIQNEDPELIEFDGNVFEVIPSPPSMPAGSRPERGWYFQHLIASVPKGCEFFKLDREIGTEPPFSTLGWDYPLPDLTTEQLEAEEWAEFQFPTWKQIVLLLLAGNASLDSAERDEREVGDSGLRPINPDVYELCAEVERSRLICLEARGAPANPSWEMKLAAQVYGETAGRRLLEDSVAVLVDESEGALAEPLVKKINEVTARARGTVERTSVALACVLGTTLLHERASRERELGSSAGHAPYAALGREWSTIQLSRAPVNVKQIGHAVDFDRVVTNFLQGVAKSEVRGSLILDRQKGEEKVDWDLSNVEAANQSLADLSRKLTQIGIGIQNLRLTLTGGFHAALYGGMLTLEAQDSSTNAWLPVHKLSASQRHWLGLGLGLHGTHFDSSTLLLADEVDSGMAERTVPQCLLLLESLFAACLVSSHSPAALRSGVGSLLHIHRDEVGRIRLAESIKGGDARETANKLGISTSELLTFLRVVVLVEGEHDKVVFESLLNVNGSAVLDTQVVPFRGVNQLTHVDSKLILEYTDASIVLVVDGARQDRIQKSLNHALSLASSRRSQKRLREATAPLRKGPASNEELVVAEMIEAAAQKGVLHRLHVVGLPTRDIIEMLPPSDFGLESDWSTYEALWLTARRKDTTTKDFKTFLRNEFKARINVDSIAESVDRLTTPPRQLWHALEVIEAAKFTSGLRTLDT